MVEINVPIGLLAEIGCQWNTENVAARASPGIGNVFFPPGRPPVYVTEQ